MKLNRLALTIVHFDAEDVIATSGPFSLSTRTGNDWYNALRSEANEAGLNYTSYSLYHQFIYFHYDAGTSSFEQAYTFIAMDKPDHYAWYSNGQWWTENKTVGSYVEDYGYDNSSTANWRTE